MIEDWTKKLGASVVGKGIRGFALLNVLGEVARAGTDDITLAYIVLVETCQSGSGKRVIGNVTLHNVFDCDPKGKPGTSNTGGFLPDRILDALPKCQGEAVRNVNNWMDKVWPKTAFSKCRLPWSSVTVGPP